MGIDLSRPGTSHRIVLRPWLISAHLPFLLLDLALIPVGIFFTAILWGRTTAHSFARRKFADWRQRIRDLVDPMPTRIPEEPVDVTTNTQVNIEEVRMTSRMRVRQRQHALMARMSDELARVRSPNRRPDGAHPPPDHYDDNPLVPPHFTVAPAMTPLEAAYKSDPPSHLWEDWKARDTEIKALVPLILAEHALRLTGRCGLYICGTPEQVVCHPRAEGSAPPAQRDRMMVFMLELAPANQHRWFDLHAALSALMGNVGIEAAHGICIRYYLEEESSSAATTPRLRPREAESQPAGEGDELSAAEIDTADLWIRSLQIRHPQLYPSHISPDFRTVLRRAHVDASRQSARRSRRRANRANP